MLLPSENPFVTLGRVFVLTVAMLPRNRVDAQSEGLDAFRFFFKSHTSIYDIDVMYPYPAIE